MHSRHSVVLALGLSVGVLSACSDDASSDAAASDVGAADVGATDTASEDAGIDAPDDTSGDAASDAATPDPLLTSIVLEGEAWPESVEFDPTTRTFYTSSLVLGSVLQVDGVTGAQTEFFAGNGEEWLGLGMAIDVDRRRLWFCTAFTKQIERGEVFALDLDTGDVEARFDLEDAAPGGACTDFALTASGAVYVTDREAPRIYRIDLDAEAPLTIAVEDEALEPEFVGQNGIVLSADETTLISGKYLPARLVRIDLAGGPDAVADLGVDFGPLTGGADDLVVLDGDLYVVMEDHVARVTLDAEWTSAVVAETYAIVANDDGTLLGGFSGIIAAEGELYVSRSDVVLFAIGLDPAADFVIQRVAR